MEKCQNTHLNQECDNDAHYCLEDLVLEKKIRPKEKEKEKEAGEKGRGEKGEGRERKRKY